MEVKNLKDSTIDEQEIERFSRIADEWWNEKGKFAPLHSMNPVRIAYIKEQVLKHLNPEFSSDNLPFKNIKILDIGCGGGLIAEPMARLGANVTAIDASSKNISVAKLHGGKMGLSIDYHCTSAEELSQTGAKFDVVLALEIIEHVADVNLFLQSATEMLNPGGVIIVSTLNRTPKSYIMAIVGAEYIMRLLPVGTHTWNKFLRPSEVCNMLLANNLKVSEMTGMVMNPVSWKWSLDPRDLAVNYMVVAQKQ